MFKQLYHVLVQSSNTVLTSQWPESISHLISAWQVTLDLVRRVPEFFLFAVERGITDINVRLTDSLLNSLAFNKDCADLLGALLNFQIYVLVNFDAMNEEILHININQSKDVLTDGVFPKILRLLQQRRNLMFCRVLLSSLLESSYVTELVNKEKETQDGLQVDCEESGYEADDSESSDPARNGKLASKGRSYIVTFKSSFHFFVECFLQVLDLYRDDQEFIYTAEYLMYKLVHNCGKELKNAKLFNEENGLTRIYAVLNSLLDTDLR